MEASSKKPFVSALASLKRPRANCFYLDLTAVRTDLISFSLQNLETCFICLEDEFNMRKTLCCGQTAHMRCIRNWIRTLIPSSVRCPGCRMDYAFPLSPEETHTLDNFMAECRQVRFIFCNSWNACDKTIQTIQNQIL